MARLRVRLANRFDERERLGERVDMACVADEFGFLLHERVMRGGVCGVEDCAHGLLPRVPCHARRDGVVVAAGEVRRDRFDALPCEIAVRAVRTPCHVRCEHQVGHGTQRAVRGQWLGVEDVEARGDVTAGEAPFERAGCDHFGAGGVDEDRAGAHCIEVFRGPIHLDG